MSTLLLKMYRICLVLFLTASLDAGVLRSGDLSLVEEETEKLKGDSLVLFDVDGTLIVPEDAILQPAEKKLFKQLVAGYTDRDLFREIRMRAPHSLVDHRSLSCIQKLQERLIPTIAFTAAPAKVSGSLPPGDWRVDELSRYGFDFRSAFPHCTSLEFPPSPDPQQTPLFKLGVLYSSFRPKGDVLLAFLERLDLHPSRVLFVDDELEHVQSVLTRLDEAGIFCIGIHYTPRTEVAYTLDPERARFQIDYFVEHNIWLSDKELDKCFSPIEALYHPAQH